MEKVKPTCYFISTNKSKFVSIDEASLRDHCEVIDFVFKPSSILSIVMSNIKLFFQLVHHHRKIDFFFVWFADYHSFLPVFWSKLFKKPSFIVLGGSDCVYVPHYRLGNIYGPLGIRKKCVVYTLNHATMLLPVDKSLINNTNSYAGDDVIKTGIMSLVNRNENSIHVSPTSIDETMWTVAEKKNAIITVANIPNHQRVRLKGIDLFLDVAREMPALTFIIVGLSESLKAKLNVPANVEVYPFMSQDQLKSKYAESKIFCMLSLYEGLPNVLLEAMASGCIPVVSNVSGMPNVAEPFGHVIKKRNVKEVVDSIDSIITSSNTDIMAMSNKIKHTYALSHRKEFIRHIVDQVREVA